MLILCFESSCDETSVAVVSADSGAFAVKSNIIASQVEIHRLYGGVVPEIASRAHIEAISKITYEALDTAGVKISDIDLVAVTSHPGLIGALLVGVNFAKSLAYANSIPLVDVDHIKGHIGAVYLDCEVLPEPPFIALAVSGGHTSMYLARSHTDYALISTTRDDAIGEAFDKIGRIMGIPYPAGADFDRLASQGFKELTGCEENFYSEFAKRKLFKKTEMKLPSPALSDGSLDFSFSGLKTAAVNLLHKYSVRGEELPRAEFAAIYTYTAIEAVAQRAASAIEKHGVKTFVIAGGVAANSHLRRRIGEVCDERGVRLLLPSVALCGDNAAMLAPAAYYEFCNGKITDLYLNASASDEIYAEGL